VLFLVAYIFLIWGFAWIVWLAAKRVTTPQPDHVFLTGMQTRTGARVSADDALAIREAIAAVYCVPANLIHASDTGLRLTRFFPLNDPLLSEFVAEAIARLGRTDLTPEIVVQRCAKERLSAWRNVAQLIGGFLDLVGPRPQRSKNEQRESPG
jgi:hypothetical protein